MAEVVRKFPDAVALVVGGAHRSGRSYAARLRARVRELGLEGNVLFTGAREDVADLMGCMDVVAHTSVQPEPFGRVIIEGMCVGRPVVATDAGGVPEFVRDGENGLLVPAGDPDALARALCRLFSDESLRARLSDGALRSVARFSVERHVRAVTDIYDSLASRYGISEGRKTQRSGSALAAGL
ncbi:MAG: glycosyltransferase [Deltaproteobacteria bacterium]|nr:MAG: glycosyltransferase [Deltaproteobacteria bacterium]